MDKKPNKHQKRLISEESEGVEQTKAEEKKSKSKMVLHNGRGKQ